MPSDISKQVIEGGQGQEQWHVRQGKGLEGVEEICPFGKQDQARITDYAQRKEDQEMSAKSLHPKLPHR